MILKVLTFILIMSILVAAHEYGHYLFARLFGMGVEEFAIGFGKKGATLWKKKYKIRNKETGELVEGETEYNFRLIPLGGFVRIKGMVPEEDGSEVRIPAGFYQASPFARLIVLLAGPAFSVLAGILIAAIVIVSWGRMVPDSAPLLGKLSPDSPALAAGLQKGDTILSIDGVPIKVFFDIVRNVRDKGDKPIHIVANRGGKNLEIDVRPVVDKEPSMVLDETMNDTGRRKIQSKLGIAPNMRTESVPVIEALSMSATLPFAYIKAFGTVIRQNQIAENVSGPVGIAKATGEAVDAGIRSVLIMAATLSISLGIMNLFPIPPFDGGQIVVALIEMARRGRRISFKLQSMVNLMGMAMIGLLFISVMYLDLTRQNSQASQRTPSAQARPK